jgi:phosphoribosyl 1,2-cyclic phosphodiesterase
VLEVKLWGVRGSLPTPLAPQTVTARIQAALEGFFDAGFSAKSDIERYMRELPQERKGGFGGNTPCCEVISGSTSILLDGGSGLRRKGNELMRGPCGNGTGETHLFLTHFHWDHVIGIPFFMPLFVPGNIVHIYAVEPEAERTLRTLFRKPNFPVPYESLGATIVYHALEPRKPFTLGNLSIAPYRLDHPDPCWGYRITDGARVLSYCVDTECTRSTRADLGTDLPLYQGVHTMVFDAQFTLIESIIKGNWGHAAGTMGIDIAMREGIGRVVFMHHDPAASDAAIAKARRETTRYVEYATRQLRKDGVRIHDVEWVFATEDMVFGV